MELSEVQMAKSEEAITLGNTLQANAQIKSRHSTDAHRHCSNLRQPDASVLPAVPPPQELGGATPPAPGARGLQN